MAATLADRSAVPFHLGLTEPVDETSLTSYAAIDGAYDPEEQIWKLPAGTPLTGPMAFTALESHSVIQGHLIIDDIHVDA